MKILSHLLKLCAPHHCLLCGTVSEPQRVCRCCRPEEVSVRHRCAWCWEEISPTLPSHSVCDLCLALPHPWYRHRFLFWYSDAVQDIIHRMKFRPDKQLATFLGEQLAERLPLLFPLQTWDLIVPVPSSPANFTARGFHPCSLMATELGKRVQIATVADTLLAFKRDTQNQGSKTIQQRLGAPRRPLHTTHSNISGFSVLLVDDICTTGATLTAATHALLAAGAWRVDVLTYTRSERWREYRSHVRSQYS